MRLTTAAFAVLAASAMHWFSIGAAGAAPRTPLTVEFTRVGTDVRVVYTLARPVAKFSFAYTPVADRDKTWELKTPGLRMEGRDIVAPSGNVERFELLVHPGVETSTIAYPSVTALGSDAVVVYPGYFIANRDNFETTLRFNAKGGDIVVGLPNKSSSWVVPPLFPPSPVSPSRYVYMGPRTQIPDSIGTFAFGTGTPEWMKGEVIRTLHAVIPFYERALGRKLPGPTTTYAVHFPREAADSASFRADVTDDFMVLLRFWGPSWSQPSADQLGLLHEIVAHEAFHFWNGSLFYPSEGEVNPWLHEGGASYMSWAAQAELFGVNPDARRKHMESSLNSCIEALGSSYLVGALHAHGWGSATYDCGEVTQWLSDVGMRKATQGGQNIFTLWQKLFAAAERRKGAYSTSDFLALVRGFDPATRAALGIFLVQDGRDRWQQLPALLAPLGIKASVGEAPERRLRETVMWHLLRTNCEAGYYGFWAKEGGMLLQTGRGCGALAGDPTIVAVEGHDLFNAARAAYSAVHARCASGGNLRLGTRGGPEINVRCSEPMLEPLPSFRLETDGLAP
jgi:hypothetical protein